MPLDSLGRPINVLDNPPELNLHAFMQVRKTIVPDDKKPGLSLPVQKVGGKSSWQGRNEIVNVETRALEHYEDEGFKGCVLVKLFFWSKSSAIFINHSRFYSETRILTTIFGLLFWDVLFADVPGAFETSFQSAPLDMFEETFYYAPKELVDKRLAEIRGGRGIEIFQRQDGMYREKKTWYLCVSWDVCSSEDLHEILGVCWLSFVDFPANAHSEFMLVHWRRVSRHNLPTLLRGLSWHQHWRPRSFHMELGIMFMQIC